MDEHDETMEEPFGPDPVKGLFYKKTKHGFKEVDAPPVVRLFSADAHMHLQMLPDPAMALARAGNRSVSLMCTAVDVSEDGDETFEHLIDWQQKARGIMYKMPSSCAGG